MIVRVMNGPAFEVAPEVASRLLELDVHLDSALRARDESPFCGWRDQMIALVADAGAPLEEDLSLLADLLIPAADLGLEELRSLLDAEAFEC